jgi:hypothetical protein
VLLLKCLLLLFILLLIQPGNFWIHPGTDVVFWVVKKCSDVSENHAIVTSFHPEDEGNKVL